MTFFCFENWKVYFLPNSVFIINRDQIPYDYMVTRLHARLVSSCTESVLLDPSTFTTFITLPVFSSSGWYLCGCSWVAPLYCILCLVSHGPALLWLVRTHNTGLGLAEGSAVVITPSLLHSSAVPRCLDSSHLIILRSKLMISLPCELDILQARRCLHLR